MIIVDAVRRACLDPEFRERFKLDPRGCLKELGFEINENIEVNVFEDSPTSMNIVLPIDGWIESFDENEADRVIAPRSGVCKASYSSPGCCYVDPADPVE